MNRWELDCGEEIQERKTRSATAQEKQEENDEKGGAAEEEICNKETGVKPHTHSARSRAAGGTFRR